MTFLWIILIGFAAGIVVRLLASGRTGPPGFLLTGAFIGQTVGW